MGMLEKCLRLLAKAEKQVRIEGADWRTGHLWSGKELADMIVHDGYKLKEVWQWRITDTNDQPGRDFVCPQSASSLGIGFFLIKKGGDE